MGKPRARATDSSMKLSYKGLMVQCNILGRSEKLACTKLDMAKEKIHKLKVRLQEVEKALEEKENEVLREIKASRKYRPKQVKGSCIEENLRCPTMENQAMRQYVMENSNHITNNKILDQFCKAKSSELQNISSPPDFEESYYVVDLPVNSFNRIDVDSIKMISESNVHPTPVFKCENELADLDAPLNSEMKTSSIQNAEAYAYTKVSAAAGYFKATAAEQILTDVIPKEVPYFAAKKDAQVYDSPASLDDKNDDVDGMEAQGDVDLQLFSPPEASADCSLLRETHQMPKSMTEAPPHLPLRPAISLGDVVDSTSRFRHPLVPVLPEVLKSTCIWKEVKDAKAKKKSIKAFLTVEETSQVYRRTIKIVHLVIPEEALCPIRFPTGSLSGLLPASRDTPDAKIHDGSSTPSPPPIRNQPRGRRRLHIPFPASAHSSCTRCATDLNDLFRHLPCSGNPPFEGNRLAEAPPSPARLISSPTLSEKEATWCGGGISRSSKRARCIIVRRDQRMADTYRVVQWGFSG
ncbi:hypothetical protein KSP40_PGU004111 [Platanthera guangdongensis]|uniref:Uncharacterized protein n=1 Tax=Platanthera guangdongensis TaxID=2320717 RepID=A0ABR2MTD8_9ASPA